MSQKLRNLLWPPTEVHRALEALFMTAELSRGAAGLPKLPAVDRHMLDWLVNAPRAVGIDGSLERLPKSALLEEFATRGTFVVTVPWVEKGEVVPYFMALVSEGLRCRVVAPSNDEVVSNPAELFDLLDEQAKTTGGDLRDVLRDLPGAVDALDALYRRDRVDGFAFGVVRYRRDGASAFTDQLDALSGRRLLYGFCVLSLLELALGAGAALTLGEAAVEGIVDRGRIMAWAMLSLANVPLMYWSTSMLGGLTVLAGTALKRRLLEGAIFVDEKILRAQGYGAALARLNEASVVERTSLAEIFALITPLSMWISAAWLFARTPWAAALLGVQVVSMVVVGLVVARLVRNYDAANLQRLKITEDLIDKIVGHRTRAIQEAASQRHDQEDRALSAYAATVASQDGLVVALSSLKRLFGLAAASVLAVAFVRGATAPELLPAAVGVFLAMQAMTAATAAVERGLGWAAALRSIGPLLTAGKERERPQRDVDAEQAGHQVPTVVAASAVSFSYRQGGRVVLRNTTLRVRRGERVLIEGRSGGGKTTLAKLIAGELRPSTGSLLVGGLDASTMSQSQWRRLVASAPQFHENHVFNNSFSFNVDPASGREGLTASAAELCEELGLDGVLSRMPAGPAQLLGETGWQLSHGERSRVFIARALLQGAKVVVFDESFAALDPVTMQRVVACVVRRAPTLFVIAHV
ncbi:ABC transporter ATP-binding protein [Labilithrix luteola]|uniref:ABC transporter ATP-binding protein n=1 Tax=Labilithrix luteola TaxID=1391654 RepID=A0A0K1QDF2_9BACT|nr:ATP-binding cassette domain-containing protein [Labilithrix luteola]AKV03784.1 ABC transporter ATP-binding protein [Labilithrix luteola]